jgi:hypothetical protein
MNIEKRPSEMFVDFENILEFANFANEIPDTNYSKDRDDEEWCGGTFEDAMTQAKTGNPELCNKLFDDVRVLEALIEEDKIGEIRDVTGEYFDVGDVISGEPECWRRDEYGEQKPVIPIYASFGMNAGISPETIFHRGAAIVAMIDELESNGFTVDLYLEKGTTYRNVTYHYFIKVKTDPIDLDTVAFILANPLCQRRLSFAVLEKLTEEDYCSGYGVSKNLPSERILQDTDLSGFYFCCSNAIQFREKNYSTLEAAKDHILKMLEDFKNNAAQVIIG